VDEPGTGQDGLLLLVNSDCYCMLLCQHCQIVTNNVSSFCTGKRVSGRARDWPGRATPSG
jgi:hypothetical protein